MLQRTVQRAMAARLRSTPWRGLTTSSRSVGGYHGVHVDVEGNGPKAVVLIPGPCGSTRTDFALAPLQSALGEEWSVVSFDPRGYGYTKIEEPRQWIYECEREIDGSVYPWSWMNRDAEDAAAIMADLGFESYSVMGRMDGANSAVWLATSHPERVNQLVLWAGYSTVQQQDVERFQNSREIMLGPHRGTKGEQQNQQVWDEWMAALKHVAEHGGVLVPDRELQRVQSKTLVLRGDSDPVVDKSHAQHLAVHIPHAKVESLLDTGHWIQAHPDFTATVAAFLRL